jgi:hypothetical protein
MTSERSSERTEEQDTPNAGYQKSTLIKTQKG